MKKVMFKKLIYTISAVYLVLFFNACSENIVGPDGGDQDENTYSAEVSFNYKTVANKNVIRVNGVSGTITIIGVDNIDSIVVQGEMRVTSETNSDVQAKLSQMSIEIQDLPNEYRLRTIQPSETSVYNYVVNFTIRVPKNIEVDVNLVAGTVSVESIHNSVTVSNVAGTVNLRELVGDTFVNVVSGLINCKQVLPLNGSIDITTTAGTILLEIPANTSAELSAIFAAGTFTSSNLNFSNPVVTTNSFTGTLSDGKGNISLKAVAGSITAIGY